MRMWTHHKISLRKDVKVYSDRCYVSLRWSKTMQAQAQATNIVIAAAGDCTCPVTPVRKYINSRPLRRNEPFFQTVAGTPVTQHLWRKILSNAAPDAGLSKRIKTHSFRRGGAIRYHELGVPALEIKCLGMWRSDCIIRYLHNPCPPPASFIKAFKRTSFLTFTACPCTMVLGFVTFLIQHD